MVRAPEHVENWLGFLPRPKDEAAYKRAVYYGAQAWKYRGVDSLANYMSAAGNDNVYAYRFDWDEEPSQLGFDLSVALGAAHGQKSPLYLTTSTAAWALAISIQETKHSSPSPTA